MHTRFTITMADGIEHTLDYMISGTSNHLHLVDRTRYKIINNRFGVSGYHEDNDLILVILMGGLYTDELKLYWVSVMYGVDDPCECIGYSDDGISFPELSGSLSEGDRIRKLELLIGVIDKLCGMGVIEREEYFRGYMKQIETYKAMKEF